MRTGYTLLVCVLLWSAAIRSAQAGPPDRWGSAHLHWGVAAHPNGHVVPWELGVRIPVGKRWAIVGPAAVAVRRAAGRSAVDVTAGAWFPGWRRGALWWAGGGRLAAQRPLSADAAVRIFADVLSGFFNHHLLGTFGRVGGAVVIAVGPRATIAWGVAYQRSIGSHAYREEARAWDVVHPARLVIGSVRAGAAGAPLPLVRWHLSSRWSIDWLAALERDAVRGRTWGRVLVGCTLWWGQPLYK